MMTEEWQPEATDRVKLLQLQREFFDYIEKNIEKIDTNIPVFYGHVAATLDNTFPTLSDEARDHFVDAVTAKVLVVSKKTNDIPFVEKLFDYAMRNKKSQKGKAIYDILLGFRLLHNGRLSEAADALRKYRSLDVTICPVIAYCYYTLSTQQMPPGQDVNSARPNEMMLAAREQMIELLRINPPVNRLRDSDIPEDPQIVKIFWFMVKRAIEWFPSESGFLRIGIEKATRDENLDAKEELLNIAIERFYNDKFFLREMYRLKYERRDAGGIAGIVKQMTQQFPDEIEPVYYGLHLSIISARSETYARFRKLAVAKEMPKNILLLVDFAFEIMCGRRAEATAYLEELRQRFGGRHYYVLLLDYVIHDAFSDDEKRVKRAKKALVDSIDQYCMKALKIPAE